MTITLSYAVDLGPDLSAESLRADVAAAFSDLVTLSSGSARGDRRFRVTTSRVGGGSYQLMLRFGCDVIGLPGGGPARLLTTALGPALRGAGLRSLRLTRVEIDPDTADALIGPRVGVDPVLRALGPDRAPYLAVPLEPGMPPSRWRAATAELVNAGAAILVDSPIENPEPAEIEDRLATISELATDAGQRVAYFANLTARLPDAFRSAQVLAEANAANVLAGARVCPFSLGLNACAAIRSRGTLLYAFNSLQVDFGRRSVGDGALTTLIRSAGADLISVGLRAADVAGTPTADEMTAAMREPLGSSPPTMPVFTGGITPRVAHRVVSQHGADVVLHTRAPLRVGDDVQRNVRAVLEAAASARAGMSIDAALGSEGRETRHWRSYETDVDD